MKKLVIVYVIIIVIVILLAVFKLGGNLPAISIPFFNSSQAEINGKTINLILADSDEEKMKGLSGRDNLSEDQGMLFVFEEKGTYGFWMKEMKFPIDIIFLDGNRVIKVFNNVQPPQGQADALNIYKPEQPANRVLELNAGKAQELGIKDGSEITFRGI